MGPGIKSDLPGPSSTRDAEVAKLRNELELSAMRLSQMKTRLLATLDELDALRTTHHRELKTEMRVKERLSEKLDRCLDEIKRAEAERDEMREVVSILVDKGMFPMFLMVGDVQVLVQNRPPELGPFCESESDYDGMLLDSQNGTY
ncbi:hypothetical protein C8Q80DRAFT_1195891 [Daedaleopsis nitida]|nr:hypothetical protein C8Q80DRAFT_1195891 [Daedaleopsis nitida]